MATALDLGLKQGDSVLLCREIYREAPHHPLFVEVGGARVSVGYTFRNAIKAEIVDVDENGRTKVRYSNGGEKNIEPGFNGFSRERTKIQKVVDFFKWAYHSYRPI